MAVNVFELLQRLSQKSNLLAQKYYAAKEEVAKVREENENLQQEKSEMQVELEKLRLENEYLRVSHKIAPTPEDVKTSRKMIAELVRNIDKCISQLNE